MRSPDLLAALEALGITDSPHDAADRETIEAVWSRRALETLSAPTPPNRVSPPAPRVIRPA